MPVAAMTFEPTRCPCRLVNRDDWGSPGRACIALVHMQTSSVQSPDAKRQARAHAFMCAQVTFTDNGMDASGQCSPAKGACSFNYYYSLSPLVNTTISNNTNTSISPPPPAAPAPPNAPAAPAGSPNATVMVNTGIITYGPFKAGPPNTAQVGWRLKKRAQQVPNAGPARAECSPNPRVQCMQLQCLLDGLHVSCHWPLAARDAPIHCMRAVPQGHAGLGVHCGMNHSAPEEAWRTAIRAPALAVRGPSLPAVAGVCMAAVLQHDAAGPGARAVLQLRHHPGHQLQPRSHPFCAARTRTHDDPARSAR